SVSVTNKMASNVVIHCKSKNDDLGFISPGNSYEWGFRVNLWQTTLFFCGFYTKNGGGVYDIFKADRDINRCPTNTCIWDVQDDAIGQGSLATVRVQITNQMASNVTIHCKSKNDDLGIHVISSGQSYGWGFKVNFWQTTLFFCGFTTEKGRGVYDIYKARRDNLRCLDGNTCFWDVEDDG
ncbi:LOW QUALITY PROTEIN: Self-incomp_S1 domain-containing protein, partial [Cephalotus follicularis]